MDSLAVHLVAFSRPTYSRLIPCQEAYLAGRPLSLRGTHAEGKGRGRIRKCHRVEAGAAKDVIEALRFIRSKRGDTQKNIDDLREYLANNSTAWTTRQ